MKKFKFLSLLIPVFTLALLTGCGSDERTPYINSLEELDQTSLTTLIEWLDENDESIEELFEVEMINVDLDGEELDWEQVLNFREEFFESWSFDVDGEDLVFSFTWDYEAATANPFATQRAGLVDWFDAVIEIMEDIDVDNPMMFIASLGGFLNGTNNALNDGSISGYARVPVENTVSSLQEVHDFVLQNLSASDLDLVDVRDTTIEFLTDMQAIFID